MRSPNLRALFWLSAILVLQGCRHDIRTADETAEAGVLVARTQQLLAGAKWDAMELKPHVKASGKPIYASLTHNLEDSMTSIDDLKLQLHMVAVTARNEHEALLDARKVIKARDADFWSPRQRKYAFRLILGACGISILLLLMPSILPVIIMFVSYIFSRISISIGLLRKKPAPRAGGADA